MNMKKTLAGLMAGVVAISAMATVAVSAKAQEAKEVTWSTMAKEAKNAETVVYVTLTAGAWDDEITLTLEGENNDAETYELKVKEITKITLRQAGNTSVIDEDLAVYYNVTDDDATIADNELVLLDVCPDAAADIEIAIKVEETGAANVDKNTIVANDGTNDLKTTNVAKDADETKKGALLNKEGLDGVDVDGDIAYIYTIDLPIADHMDAEGIEPSAEIADELLDAKGATIAFNFAKTELESTASDNTFDHWTDRYDWANTNMKSAISLRVNNSTKLSVDMMEFDKENFTAVYSWDEVMSKFQVGSYAGLVRSLGLKIDNSKLPNDKDGNLIDLRLESITVKVPEMAETEDDTMVEDFAAGESATVVEDTLPAATDAPAADAPAADAPATTDAAANPETGNSAVALLAIPAALAAAAIVAKKRG